jgi:hypothetical protein
MPNFRSIGAAALLFGKGDKNLTTDSTDDGDFHGSERNS